MHTQYARGTYVIILYIYYYNNIITWSRHAINGQVIILWPMRRYSHVFDIVFQRRRRRTRNTRQVTAVPMAYKIIIIYYDSR